MASITTRTPVTLPSELWVRILSLITGHDDRPHLWVSGRHVCTLFRGVIESIFQERHLPRTTISYSLNGYEPNTLIRVAPLDVDFEFDCLSDDKSVAFFKVEHPIDPKRKETIVHKLQHLTNSREYESTLHIVRVRNHLNDTPIPHIRIDYDKLEVSCDWRTLFTHLYAEEVLCSSLMVNNSKLEAAKEQIGDQIAAGQLDAGKAVEEAFKLISGLLDDNRKMVRRARTWRLYEQNPDPENPEFHWEASKSDLETEKRIMEELKIARLTASFESDSDDESVDESDDEESGDGEESGEEEDEWEDEEDEEDEVNDDGK